MKSVQVNFILSTLTLASLAGTTPWNVSLYRSKCGASFVQPPPLFCSAAADATLSLPLWPVPIDFPPKKWKPYLVSGE